MEVKKKSPSPRKLKPKIPPKHAVVPGAHFTVDWHFFVSDEFSHSFLSHAHSDHMAGISSFRPPRVLHCSEITGKLVALKYPKVALAIQTHQFSVLFEVEGFTVVLIPANHTPGSSMFLFMRNGKRILFTGDFRAEPNVIENVCPYGPIDQLFVDSTFLISGLNIPPRR